MDDFSCLSKPQGRSRAEMGTPFSPTPTTLLSLCTLYMMWKPSWSLVPFLQVCFKYQVFSLQNNHLLGFIHMNSIAKWEVLLVCPKKYKLKCIAFHNLASCIKMLIHVVVAFLVAVRYQHYRYRAPQTKQISGPMKHLFFSHWDLNFILLFPRFNREVSSGTSFKALTWRNKS